MEMKPLWLNWYINIPSIVTMLLLAYAYFSTNSVASTAKKSCFWASMILFCIAEFSPLHFIGMHYYFSVHMVSHIIVLLICGPLLVLSLSEQHPNRFIISLSAFMAKRYWLGWFAGVGIMWFWHIPAIFNASMNSMPGTFSFLPLISSGSMLLAGCLFAWPIFSPIQSARVHSLAGIVYLFTACISCSLLGLLITFAPLNTYSHYANAQDMMNMASANFLNLSRQQDQQAAGLIMWVPCCLVYLSGCIYLLTRWFGETDTAQKINTLNLTQLHQIR